MLKNGRESPLHWRRQPTQATYGQQYRQRRSLFAWAVLAVLLVAVVAFLAVLVFRGYPTPPAGVYYAYPFVGWLFFPFGILFLLFVLFFVSRLIFWPMGGGWRRRYWYGYGGASEIVRQRYARGEITKEQFDQMKRDLEQR